MLLRGVKFLPPTLDRADIEATKGRANSSGRSFGGAPLRGGRGGGRGRGGHINYADDRPNPFAQHLNANFAPPLNGFGRGGPPPPGQFNNFPPPPPRGNGYQHGAPPPHSNNYYNGPPLPAGGRYNGPPQLPPGGYYSGPPQLPPSGYGNHGNQPASYGPPQSQHYGSYNGQGR
jgi:5'-3' exoribonuclease 2